MKNCALEKSLLLRMCYERTFSIEISSMSFWSQSRKPKYESSPRLFFFSPSAQIQPGHTKITRARRRFTELLKKNYKSKKCSEYLKVITNYGNIATICYESKYIVISNALYLRRHLTRKVLCQADGGYFLTHLATGNV